MYYNTPHKVSGILQFDPRDVTKKHQSQSSWKRTAMVNIDSDMCEYYSWYVWKRYSIKLSTPLRGCHLTIINDKIEGARRLDYDWVKSQYNKKKIEIEYGVDPRTDGFRWWLKANCDEVGEIRKKVGLNIKPFFGLHITIGNTHEKYLQQSEYIKGLVDKFGKEYN